MNIDNTIIDRNENEVINNDNELTYENQINNESFSESTPQKVSTTQTSNDEFHLTASDIIDIILIAVGIVIILLAIAILIRIK